MSLLAGAMNSTRKAWKGEKIHSLYFEKLLFVRDESVKSDKSLCKTLQVQKSNHLRLIAWTAVTTNPLWLSLPNLCRQHAAQSGWGCGSGNEAKGASNIETRRPSFPRFPAAELWSLFPFPHFTWVGWNRSRPAACRVIINVSFDSFFLQHQSFINAFHSLKHSSFSEEFGGW